MENSELDLALSFISEQPHAAAKIIEQQPVEKTVEFIENIPLNFQKLLIQQLLPVHAARVMENMESESATSIASSLEVSVLTRILRQMSENQALDILQGLGRLKRNACELIMNYPNYSVGAWMKPELAVVTSDMSVGDARTYLENTYQGEESDFIYVTDRAGKLEGRLTALSLLKAKPMQLVHELMLVDPPWMSPNFLLANASKSYLWDKNDMVVVVDRESRILGLLKHADLRIGLSYEEGRRAPILESNSNIFATFSATYIECITVLFNTVLDTVETDLRS